MQKIQFVLSNIQKKKEPYFDVLSMPWDLNGHLDLEYYTRTVSIAGNVQGYHPAIAK